MKKLLLISMVTASFALTGCGDNADTSAKQSEVAPAVQEQPVVAESTNTEQLEITTVTEDNYDIAETQGIIEGYVKKISDATNTNGMGVFWHVRKGADPTDKTIPRINFDTIYSWVILDLTEGATLVMPETNGRYQSAWFMDEEHYNPLVFEKPGTYKITQENVGSRYVVLVIRTQTDVNDEKDLALAAALQDQLEISQKDTGSYVPKYKFDQDDVVKMRIHFQNLAKEKGLTSEVMFGKKGERTDEQHNAGTAVGWGGLTPKQAVYPLYYPTSTEYQTLTLKDVPTKAFWSVTVYDEGGFAATDTYNINSQFAVTNEDGSVTINFGGDKNADNYMETFEGWNFALRIYQPEEAYFNGDWEKPELVSPK